MAITGTTVWEVRTTGNAANGGGWDSALGGTDYSQQNAAQVAYTDLVIDATTNTKCTSAGNPFTSNHVGNIINVTGGTGFTVQRVQVVSVAAGVATCDKSLGTLGSTGGTGNLGGALASIENADAVYAPGNIIYIESGTYTKTTTRTLTCDGTLAGGDIWFIGYPVGGGSRSNQAVTESSMPVLTSATNSINIVTLTNANFLGFKNIKATHTAATRGSGFTNATTATSNGARFVNCITDGCSYGFDFGNGASTTIVGVNIIDCTVRNGTAGGIRLLQGQNASFVHGCYILDCAGPGITIGNTTTGIWFVCTNTIIDSMTGASGYGIHVTCTTATTNTAAVQVIDCDFWNNAKSGIYYAYTTGRMPTHFVANCIFVNNGTYGQSCATAGIIDGTQMVAKANAYYNNTSGARQNVAAGDGDVTLTGDPFTSATGSDFSLNNTASAGAACRAAGWPARVGALGATAGTGYKDIGPLQAQATAGGGTVAYGFAG